MKTLRKTAILCLPLSSPSILHSEHICRNKLYQALSLIFVINYASKREILLRLIEELIYGLVKDFDVTTRPNNRPTQKKRDQ